MIKTAVILAAGLQERSPNKEIHKSLLPIGNQPVIAHILDKFDCNDKIIIAINNNQYCKHLKDFCLLAYPNRNINFVLVDDPTIGPGYSLSCCQEYLQCPFYIITCDTYFEENLQSLPINKNWLSVSKVHQTENWYCVDIDNDKKITNCINKQKCDLQYAFTGLAYIKDYEEFWKFKNRAEFTSMFSELIYISKCNIYAIETSWQDVGNQDNFNKACKEIPSLKMSLGRKDQILYHLKKQHKIIKYFLADGMSQKTYNYLQDFKQYQPYDFRIPKDFISLGNFISYHFIDGIDLYHVSDGLFKEFLLQLSNNRINVKKINENMWHKCFMEGKKRWSRILTHKNDKLEALEAKLYNYFSEIYPHQSIWIHGDCQPSNFIYSDLDNQIYMIDCTPNEHKCFEYELAKMSAGLLMNFNDLKNGIISSSNQQYKKTHDFQQIFNLSIQEVKYFAAGIYYKSAPLHNDNIKKVLLDYACYLLEIKND